MSGRKLEAACPQPCDACPWRTANHGKPHPHGWYRAKNLARLWAKLRRGETMSCHPTDPDNLVPEGAPQVPDDRETHECAGALVLVQRELTKVNSFDKPAVPQYRKAHGRGLTQHGVLAWIERIMFGGVPLVGGVKVTRPDLNAEVSHPPLGDWEEWLKAHPEVPK